LGGFSCVSWYIKLLCGLVECFNYPLAPTLPTVNEQKSSGKESKRKFFPFLDDFFLIVLSCSSILIAEKYIGKAVILNLFRGSYGSF
jgi:hypothetical protein